MEYEKSGSKKIRKSSAVNESIKSINTSSLVWALVKRHKFGLVSVYAVIVTLLLLFPMIGVELGALLK